MRRTLTLRGSSPSARNHSAYGDLMKQTNVNNTTLAPLRAERDRTLPAALGDKSDLKTYLVTQLSTFMATTRHTSPTEKDLAIKRALAALEGLAPQDGAEDLLTVQMISAHQAAMECLKQSAFEFQSRDRNLIHAQRFLSLYLSQLQVLDKRRGAGAQRMMVGTVNVEAGAQAIVGNVAKHGETDARP